MPTKNTVLVKVNKTYELIMYNDNYEQLGGKMYYVQLTLYTIFLKTLMKCIGKKNKPVEFRIQITLKLLNADKKL